MNLRERWAGLFRRLPTHTALILLAVLWILPTIGIFVTSFRSREAVRTSGWWKAVSPPPVQGGPEYLTYCASCHGEDGAALPQANLSDPELVAAYPRSNRLLGMLRREVDGAPHLIDPPLPSNPNEALAVLAPVLEYLQSLSGSGGAAEVYQLSLRNYADALVGYKGTQDYLTDCREEVASRLAKFKCDASDLLNPEGIGQAFLNTLAVALPATLLPILLAAFAAYAFAWMQFPGRYTVFALLVGLQIIPLQIALIPIARMYADLGMQNSYLGIWLFHTAFALPYAIYLMRNFFGTLPREMFESAHLDGANHFTTFRHLALPLAGPAIASLAIFQFLWVWNDFLVAKIFLTGKPVLTVQITNLIDPRGGNWHILTGAAFLSFLVPMIVFFAFQRFFVRGITAGSVKG